MKYVVYGPYPPMPGDASSALFTFVRELVDEGKVVQVVSPVPSAAHAHADLGGARGAVRFGRVAAGADRVVIRLDATGLAIDREAPSLVAGRIALGAVLRRAAEVRLELERMPATVHPRWVQWVASAATTVVVSEETARSALTGAGLDEAKVVVDSGLTARVGDTRKVAVGREQPRWRLSESPSRTEVQAAVRARAAASRTASASVGPATTGSASRPLRLVAPLGFPPIKSRNPVFGTAKKVLRRLVAWQLEPIVQHVNQLHTASIEAVDEATSPAQPGPGSGSSPSD